MSKFSKNLHSQLDSAQLAVATHLRGPVCVLAGAGAGKTRAITYRIANAVHQQIAKPQQILAVTFTTRAAGEMRSRLQALKIHGVQVKTFHAAALAQLNYFWSIAIGGKVPEIKENSSALVSQAAASLGMPTDTPTIRDLRDEIAWSKVQLIPAEEYPQKAIAAGHTEIAGQSLTDIAQLITAYEDLKIERAVIDFEDVILILIGLLIDRPDIAKQIRQQYQYFVVDEYQDVSPMQHRLLQLWLGTRKDICVVGDIAQTIYSFAGANSQYLANFPEYWAGAKKIILDKDYRSTPEIVTLANKVINTAQTPNSNKIILKSARHSGKEVSFEAYDHDAAEVAGIVAKIKKLIANGTKLQNIAILYRMNSQSALFEKELSVAQIPYTIRGGKKFFERIEVLRAMVAFRAVARTNTENNFQESIDDALYQLGWRKEAPTNQGISRERWESLNTLRKMSEEFITNSQNFDPSEKSLASTILSFVNYLEERAKFELEPELECITLSSLHGAKGLEWPVVFLAGVSEGLLPISYAKSESALAEERRLFYVGITRAADELYISYSKENLNGKKRKASQFLATIWPTEISASTQKRIKAKNKRQEFQKQDAQTRRLFEVLNKWRSEKAQKEGKLASLIFQDSVLYQIAINKPRTIAELAEIKGVGSLKLSRYGMSIIELTANFQNAENAQGFQVSDRER